MRAPQTAVLKNICQKTWSCYCSSLSPTQTWRHSFTSVSGHYRWIVFMMFSFHLCPISGSRTDFLFQTFPFKKFAIINNFFFFCYLQRRTDFQSRTDLPLGLFICSMVLSVNPRLPRQWVIGFFSLLFSKVNEGLKANYFGWACLELQAWMNGQQKKEEEKYHQLGVELLTSEISKIHFPLKVISWSTEFKSAYVTIKRVRNASISSS